MTQRQKDACPTAQDAVIAAMEAIDALDANETVHSVDLGEYSPSIGGGFYWRVSTGIARGNAISASAYDAQRVADNKREFKLKLLKRMEEMVAGVESD
jgi:hypothetical protein